MATQFMVNIFAQSTNNVLVYLFIVNSQYVKSEYLLPGEKELVVLDVQFGMQCV